jgi:hypothetical protein
MKMEYYKGFLDKEWIRKQLRKQGIELRGKPLTDFCYEVQGYVETEDNVNDIIATIIKHDKQQRL